MRRVVAKFGIHIHAEQSGLDGAGEGLFASVSLSKGTVIPYGSAQHKIYNSSADALSDGAPVSHLHVISGTKHCIDGALYADVPRGGAELANQPLANSVPCKLDLNPTAAGLDHCAILTQSVAAGEEIYSNYGSHGWSFLISVGFLDLQNNRSTHTPVENYKEHWLYMRYMAGGLPQGHVAARMKELFP